MIEFLALFIVLLGIFLGWLLAKRIPEELYDGRLYFKLLEVIILLILSLFLLDNFKWYLFLFGIILGYFFRKEYFYFSFINFNAFLLSLVFFYSLPYATLRYKGLFWSGLFLFSFFMFFINYNFDSFSLGGLLVCIIFKVVRFK